MRSVLQGFNDSGKAGVRGRLRNHGNRLENCSNVETRMVRHLFSVWQRHGVLLCGMYSTSSLCDIIMDKGDRWKGFRISSDTGIVGRCLHWQSFFWRKVTASCENAKLLLYYSSVSIGLHPWFGCCMTLLCCKVNLWRSWIQSKVLNRCKLWMHLKMSLYMTCKCFAWAITSGISCF